LRNGAAVAGTVLTAGALGNSRARAQSLPVPDSAKTPGRIIQPKAYGMPSKYESHVVRTRSDVFVNKQNLSDWSMTPLQHQRGIVTPNGLIFERHHAGTPDIDPDTHRLVIHGMVKQPLQFTMDDLMRYPSVSKFYFLECSGNTLTDWTKAASTTVQQSHGLLSAAQWTGIPVSWLLDEAGLDAKAKWVLFEGADGSAHTRSIPIEKVLDDVLLVYAQNGEMLRAEQGYPLRAFIPGWEGNVSVKWLRRIKAADQPWNFRSETARYADPIPEGKWRQFTFVMEAKSVITTPSGGMKLNGPGLYEIQGFAWSGRGKVSAVDVTVDGGKTWQPAVLEEPVLDKMLTRFRYRWNWDGTPSKIASRVVDSTGYVQPSVEELGKVRALSGFVQHHNGIFPWSITSSGEVKNAVA
jgi:sulfane dehydrogenase subunit SoxC